MVLSDDLVWAYSTQTGGAFDPSSFSIQLPQSIVTKSATYVLEHKIRSDSDLNYGKPLPGGTSLLEILRNISLSEQKEPRFTTSTGGGHVNPLVQVLLSIPQEEILLLQEGVKKVAPYFIYYRIDPTQTYRLPMIAKSLPPNGGAISVLEEMLYQRKVNADVIRKSCQVFNLPSLPQASNLDCFLSIYDWLGLVWVSINFPPNDLTLTFNSIHMNHYYRTNDKPSMLM